MNSVQVMNRITFAEVVLYHTSLNMYTTVTLFARLPITAIDTLEYS